jgi:hypothetical protein
VAIVWSGSGLNTPLRALPVHLRNYAPHPPAAQELQRFQQQICSLAGIGAAADGAEQHQRTVVWQTQQRLRLGLIAGGPHVEIDRSRGSA